MVNDRELKLILSCNGRTLPLGKGEDFDIEEVTGLESSEFRLQSNDIALVDGENIVGKKIGPRSIHIEASLRDDGLNEGYRKDVIRFFNPKYTGLLYVNNMGVERQIEYEIEGWTFEKQDNLWVPLKIIVDLRCPDPFMMGLENTALKITKSRKAFAFPYVSLGEPTVIEGEMAMRGYKGTVMGYKVPENIVNINNDGDVPTGYVVTMKATRGAVRNPRMVNFKTGERIRLVLDMREGDTLTINISDRLRTIKLNGENAYFHIDRSSRPFMIDVGDNEINFFADEGFGNLDINMKYSLRYLGV